MRPLKLSGAAVALLKRIGVAAALFTGAAIVHAVTISPVVVELSPSRRIVSITFTNPGDQPLRYQSSTFAWHQVDGEDRREPTDDLIVAPPIADIAPGGRQIFRVTLRRPATGREQAYRLVFEDVTATSTAAPATDDVAIHFRVNQDLPVFVSAPGQPKPTLRIEPCQGVVGACVRIENAGDRYAQVKSLGLDRGTWHKDMPVNARVLAGAWKQWPIELPAGTRGPLKVNLQTRDGVVGGELPVADR